MARRDKFILLEEDKQEILPAVELQQEPLPLSPAPEALPVEEKIPEEVKVNAFSSIINSAISREFESIDALNSAISTFMVERPEDLASIEIFKRIIEEKTAHIGMFQAIMGIIDGKAAELVKAGEEKAEEIAEPKEEIKESLYSDANKYWRDWVLAEIEHRISQEEDYTDEVYKTLRVIEYKDLKNIANEVATRIEGNSYVWETVDSVFNESIEEEVDSFVENAPLTAEINVEPSKKSDKKVADKPKKIKESMSSDNYWKEYAEGEVEFRLADEEWVVQGILLRDLSQEDIKELVEFVASSIKSSIQNNDQLWEYVNEVADEAIEWWVTKKFDPKNLTAEINPDK